MNTQLTYGERFYRSRWNNLGTILAVVAGVLSYAFLTWSVGVPQARGNFGVIWGIGTFVAAGAYIFAAWDAENNWVRSRMILMGVGAAQIVTGVLASLMIGPQGGLLEWLAGMYDLIPAVLALIAGILVHPPSSEAVRRSRSDSRA